MGLSLEDYKPRWLEIEAETKRQSIIQQTERQQQKQQLRELLVDPKWEMYAQEVDKRLQVSTAAVDNLAKKMLEGDLDTFKKLMPDYRYNLGIKTALENVLLIVRETQKA